MGQAKIKRLNRQPNPERLGKFLAAQFEHVGCCDPRNRCSKFNQAIALTLPEQAAEKALKEIRSRSFSGRHPELDKMFKCHVCNRRHRASVVHEQTFTKRWEVKDGKKVYTDEQLIAGKTPETESLIEARRIRLEVGASAFKGKRKHPPLNRRSNEFVQVVRDLLPNEYTHEELEKARRKAKRILIAKYGRYGFLPLLWQSQKETREKATANIKETGSTQVIQSSEAEVSVS